MVKVPVPYAEPSQRIKIICFSTAHSPKEYGKLLGLCLISDGKYSWQDLVHWAVNHLEGKYLRIYINWLGGGCSVPPMAPKKLYYSCRDNQNRDIKKDVRASVERAKSGRKTLYLI